MKILSRQQTKQQSKFPMRVECEWCESELEIDEKDVEIGHFGLYHFTCPCCNRDSYTEDGIKLTKENLNFPQHYYSFKDGVRVENKEINKMVGRCISACRNNHSDYASTTSGDTAVVVKRYSDDEEYNIIVAKNYFEVDIPFEECDYWNEEEENQGE